VQQTHLGTIRDWNYAGENFNSENKVVLTNVYRNTKQIIEYIKSLGYEVDVATNLRDGKAVTEEVIKDKNLQISRIQEIIDSKQDDVVGILVKTPSEKAKLLESLNLEPESSVKIMTIHESQGVEFDVVILLYQAKDFQISENLDQEQKTEKSKVNKDLLYVASTRAINELYVLYDEEIKIKDCNL
jgi:DNA helicase IV